jgi:hypothetical protein
MKTTIYILRKFGRNKKNTAKNGLKSSELIFVKNRVASLTALLETVGLSLDLSGRLPNLAVVDALAIGLIGQ